MQQSTQFDISKITGFIKRRWKWFLVPFITGLIGTIVLAEAWPWRKYPATCIIDIGATVEEKDIDRELHRYGTLRETNAKDKLEELRSVMLSDERIRDLLVGGRTVGRIEGLAARIDSGDPVAVAIVDVEAFYPLGALELPGTLLFVAHH